MPVAYDDSRNREVHREPFGNRQFKSSADAGVTTWLPGSRVVPLRCSPSSTSLRRAFRACDASTLARLRERGRADPMLEPIAPLARNAIDEDLGLRQIAPRDKQRDSLPALPRTLPQAAATRGPRAQLHKRRRRTLSLRQQRETPACSQSRIRFPTIRSPVLGLQPVVLAPQHRRPRQSA